VNETAHGTEQPEVIILAGTESTGGPALQRWLARNPALLAVAGMRVLDTGRPASGTAKHVIPWREPGAMAWRLLAEEVSADPSRRLLLANEGLWRQPPEVLRSVRRALTGRVVRVVLYVREQAEYLQTATLEHQRLPDKAFDINDPAAFSRFANARRPAYYDACRRFEALFGQGSVTVRLAEADALVGGHIVSDFCSLVDIEPPDPATFPQPEPVLTAGLAEALRTRRKELRSLGGVADQVDLALRLSMMGVGSPWFLSEKKVFSVRLAYRTQNARLASEYLTNADHLPTRSVFVSVPDDVEAATASLLDHVACAGRMGRKGWGGGPGPAKRMFADGWELTDRVDEAPAGAGGTERPPKVMACPTGREATVRFMAPLDRVLDRDTVHLSLRTLYDQPLEATCRVNGQAVGSRVFPPEQIDIPFADLGPLGIIELSLDLEPEAPPVTAITLSDDWER
jgi:hypothetical protein